MNLLYNFLVQNNHKLKGTYYQSNGKLVFDNYGAMVAVFISVDFRYACIVSKYYGDYKIAEI